MCPDRECMEKARKKRALQRNFGIAISEERLDEELAKMAKMYRMEAAKLKEMMSDRDKEQIKNDIAIQEAVKMITDAAKEVEAVKEEKEEEKAE